MKRNKSFQVVMRMVRAGVMCLTCLLALYCGDDCTNSRRERLPSLWNIKFFNAKLGGESLWPLSLWSSRKSE